MSKEIIFSLEKTVYVKYSRVALDDICQIVGVHDRKIKDVFFNIRKAAKTITAFEIYKMLADMFPDYTVTNIGPTECTVIVDDAMPIRTWTAIKVFFLCVVMFFGGAIAIMTFHEDVDMRGVHSGIYYFFTGVEQAAVPIVSIPYSLGIAIGFIFLFGLYKRKSKKPTVLEVDMNEHETAMKNYMADTYKDKDG